MLTDNNIKLGWVKLGCKNRGEVGRGGGQVTLFSVCLTLMRMVSFDCMPSFV